MDILFSLKQVKYANIDKPRNIYITHSTNASFRFFKVFQDFHLKKNIGIYSIKLKYLFHGVYSTIIL